MIAALLTAGGASAAWAEQPVDLGGSQLVDEAGVLSASQETQVRNSIEDYDSATGSDLRVVFVKTFEDPADRTGWAEATWRTADSQGQSRRSGVKHPRPPPSFPSGEEGAGGP